MTYINLWVNHLLNRIDKVLIIAFYQFFLKMRIHIEIKIKYEINSVTIKMK